MSALQVWVLLLESLGFFGSIKAKYIENEEPKGSKKYTGSILLKSLSYSAMNKSLKLFTSKPESNLLDNRLDSRGPKPEIYWRS